MFTKECPTFSKQQTRPQTAQGSHGTGSSASKSSTKTCIVEHAEEEFVCAEQLEEVIEAQRNTLAHVERLQSKLGEVEKATLTHAQSETSARLEQMSEILTHQTQNSEGLLLVRKELMWTNERLQKELEEIRAHAREAAQGGTASILEKLTDLIACQRARNSDISALEKKLTQVKNEIQSQPDASTAQALLMEALGALREHAKTLERQIELNQRALEPARELSTKGSEEKSDTSESIASVAGTLAELNETMMTAAQAERVTTR
jgi:hypothetical protein